MATVATFRDALSELSLDGHFHIQAQKVEEILAITRKDLGWLP